MQTLINFIVALPSEARPLIASLRLRPCVAVGSVKIYAQENYRLVISGVGKIASAAAVGYVAGREPPDTHHVWLNVGIAGHANLGKGSICIAHSITDQATGNAYYPAIVFRAPCASSALVCHDAATTNYAGDAMCDMESSGFFAAAARFSSIEFIHSLKIVSDNSDADIKALNRATISRLIEDNLTPIETVTGLLKQLAASHLTQPVALPLDFVLSRWHFTTTQQTQLRELARRWALVRADQQWPPEELLRCNSSRDVIARLGAILEETTLQLRLPVEL